MCVIPPRSGDHLPDSERGLGASLIGGCPSTHSSAVAKACSSPALSHLRHTDRVALFRLRASALAPDGRASIAFDWCEHANVPWDTPGIRYSAVVTGNRVDVWHLGGLEPNRIPASAVELPLGWSINDLRTWLRTESARLRDGGESRSDPAPEEDGVIPGGLSPGSQ